MAPSFATRLPVTRPGDATERAADALAHRTTSAAEQGPVFQPRSSRTDRVAGSAVVPPTGGRPLDTAVRAEMSSSFGHDFSRVRVHSGPEAAELAQRAGARAYTVGPDIVLGRGEVINGAAGRGLLAHELAHVVQYDLSGQAVLARQTPPTSPPVAAVSHYEETPLPGGRVRIRAWGKVGDPIDRPGLEKKYPLPGQIGLSGYDRWHLAGPDATGAEEGIAYAPKNFNISKTAEVENVLRRARVAVREQGGEVFFDFEAECRVIGDRQGVSIRVVENVHWQAEVRAAGSDKLVSILNERAVVPGAVMVAAPSRPRVGPPTAAAPVEEPHVAAPPTPKVASPTVTAPVEEPHVGTPPTPKVALPKVAVPVEEPHVAAPVGPRGTAPRQVPGGSHEGGAGVGTAIAAGLLDMIAQLIVQHYVQEILDKKNAEAFKAALIAQQPRITALITGQQKVAAELQARGNRAYVNITLLVRYTSDVTGQLGGGTVFMGLEVKDVKIDQNRLERVTTTEASRSFWSIIKEQQFGSAERLVSFSLTYPELEMASKEE